jgi:hypothetical protein
MPTGVGGPDAQGESQVKKWIVSAAMLVLFAGSALAQDMTYEVPNEFSFKYSEGWNKGHRKGSTASELDWLVSTADPTASFHPVLAHADFSYDDWIRRTVKQATPERALASKTEFVTAEGDKGEKLVWNIKAKDGKTLTSYNYMFDGKKNAQLQLNAIVDTASAAKFELEFDKFAKSLVIAKGK